MTEKNSVGEKIRQFRESHEMSVEELAKESQSSVELIEKLEAGELIPSLTPLLKIARALGVRLGTFLDDAPQTGPVVVRNGASDNVVRFSGKSKSSEESALDFHSLAADKQARNMEPFIIDVHPFKNDEEHELSSHEGEEFIYILEGNIEVIYGNETYTLTVGDSIYYDSVVPHDVHAAGTEAKILAVVYTPI
ncbi:helix-turn-helix domain-containing protein [Methanococcoides sp. NM1]|uniref:helix-turn-helix domain-containing protein n=1 Tax=Methanococcoides sp. NM1 TaxID=1201013 RepID=UPI0010844F09|nr:XRE family transcriptional regulator [Methanococcoides sp. NM1]